ncbi:hypothetical protein [Roseibium aggregatum]|nr:hypothetical protein [Roseibium aggregatum]
MGTVTATGATRSVSELRKIFQKEDSPLVATKKEGFQGKRTIYGNPMKESAGPSVISQKDIHKAPGASKTEQPARAGFIAAEGTTRARFSDQECGSEAAKQFDRDAAPGKPNRNTVTELHPRKKRASCSNSLSIVDSDSGTEQVDRAKDFVPKVISLHHKTRPDLNWKYGTLEQKAAAAILEVLSLEGAESVGELVQRRELEALDSVENPNSFNKDADAESWVLKEIVDRMQQNDGARTTWFFDKNTRPDVRRGVDNLQRQPGKGCLKNGTGRRVEVKFLETKKDLKEHDRLIEARLNEAARNGYLCAVGVNILSKRIVRKRVEERAARNRIDTALFSYNGTVTLIDEYEKLIDKHVENCDLVSAIKFAKLSLKEMANARRQYLRIERIKKEFEYIANFGMDEQLGFERYHIGGSIMKFNEVSEKDLEAAEQNNTRLIKQADDIRGILDDLKSME